MSAPESDRDVASQAIRGLLAGEVPGTIDLAQFNGYSDVLQALAEAHQAGGMSQVRRVWTTLVKVTPSLAELASGDGRPREWTASDLLAAKFPDPKWAAPGVVPVGLSSLAGRPKVGKSWMGLQLAHAVGTGGQFLGKKVELGRVLYFALEDSPRRLQDRLKRQGVPAHAAIVFSLQWEGAEGFEKQIVEGKYSLIIIDTISRVLGELDQNDGGEMNKALGQLQQISLAHDLAILLIDHHKKSLSSAGPIDDLLGATAKSAVLDAALGLYREQGRHGATLRVTGRDLEEQEIALEWDARICSWHALGGAEQVREDSLRGEVLGAIKALTKMGELATTTKIAVHIGKDKGNTSRALADLVASGKVEKGASIGKQQPYRVLSS